MLRSQKRLLKEYLNGLKDDSQDAHRDRKRRLKDALDNNKPIPVDLRSDIKLRQGLSLETAETLTDRRDDEYRLAGSYDPKLLITTSSDPSQPCVRFAKELKLLFPNSERINRGQTTEKDLAELCRKNDITDLVEVSGSDGQGRPTMLRVCHFPFGPTAMFTLGDIVMRADLPSKPPHMSQSNPNLIFDNFGSKTGKRFVSILKYLFPVPSPKSKRVITFANLADKIYMRHHMWESSSTLRKFRGSDPALENMTQEEKDHLASRLEIHEVGPRFSLVPYRILRGTIEMKEADIEWTRTSFLRKGKSIL